MSSVSSVAAWSSTEALQLFVILVLPELVVVSKLISFGDVLLRENEYVGFSVDNWGLGVAVCLARVVEVSCLTSEESCIDNVLVINFEHITITYSLFFILPLPHVSYCMPDDLSDIFDEYITFFKSLLSEKPYPVDFTLANFKFLRSI